MPDPSALCQQFLAAIAGLSTREAAARTGLAFSTIARLRRGEAEGLQPRTQRKMQAYLDGQPILHDGDDRRTTGGRITVLEARVGTLEGQLAALVRQLYNLPAPGRVGGSNNTAPERGGEGWQN